MTEVESNNDIRHHLKKMDEFFEVHSVLGRILTADKIFQEFCDENEINFLWVKHHLKEVQEEFFIITQQEFLDYLEYPELADKFVRLFKFLIDLRFIRYYENDKYLLSELFKSFCDLCDTYRLESIEFFEKYAKIDSMKVADAIKYYHECYKDDGMWATETYCKYFGLEHNDEFLV